MNGKQLRNSILQWAIQGKLVPQDPNDEPASVLLDKIRKEKERLIREGKLKKDKQESIIYRGEDGKYYERIGKDIKCIDEKISFEIPQGWEWCRLKDLAIYHKGPFGSSLTKSMFVTKSKNSIKVYEQKNAIQKDYTLGDFYISQEKFGCMQSFVVKPNDIIVSCAGTIGETYLLPKNAPIGIINQALMRVCLFLMDLAPYWQLYFAYVILKESKMKGSGTAIKNIPPFEYLKKILVPLPPLAEQKRMMDKYLILLSHVKRYEKAQEGLDKIHAEIKNKLKASILQEAIQGKLVPQDPNDEPAIELLKRINPKFTPTKYDEPLPQGWSVCKMSMICSLEDGDKITGKEMINLDAKYLRGQSEGTLLTSGKYITANSLVILVDGENSGEVFRTPIEGYQGSTFKKLIIDSRMNEDYILQVINSLRIKLRSNKVGAAIPHLNKKLFAEIMVLIPPLNEQQRIVDKLELLLSQLETKAR